MFFAGLGITVLMLLFGLGHDLLGHLSDFGDHDVSGGHEIETSHDAGTQNDLGTHHEVIHHFDFSVGSAHFSAR